MGLVAACAQFVRTAGRIVPNLKGERYDDAEHETIARGLAQVRRHVSSEVVDPCWPELGRARPNLQPISTRSARRVKFRLERTPESTNPRASTYRALGLQRARVRAVALRCEQLLDAAAVAEQLSFDAGREHRLRAERAVDALNARFGSGTVGPEASYLQAG